MTDKDEYLKVLDFLEHGRSDGKNEPTAQGIGTKNFNLLEVVMREDEHPKGGEDLYIGEGDREEVKYIKGRISYDELTASARSELKYVLDAIVSEQEDRFVEFFNEATPVTPRRHAFELLPGVGNKLMQSMLDAREESEFESFEDLDERVSAVPDPKQLVTDRIMNELKGEAKQKLFT
ncbi:MAG: DUF655 domain-containing protein [Candidatus Nanohaloarchaea archaeon]